MKKINKKLYYLPSNDQGLNKNFTSEPYMHRDVLSLIPISQWTGAEEAIHLSENRILQKGFLDRDPQQLVRDGKLLREDWLTDIASPSVKSALILNIAKDIVIKYKISDKDYESTCHDLYNRLLKKQPNLIQEIEQQVSSNITSMNQGQSLRDQALQLIDEKNKLLESRGDVAISKDENSYSAAERIILDKNRKKIVNHVVSEYLDPVLPEIAKSLEIETKPIEQSNADFVFLGAAGSGKSTISKQILDSDKKNDYIILATDNYRSFTLPDTPDQVGDDSKNVFARTQDIAYMVKELIVEKVVKMNERPNVICDCITLDQNMRNIISSAAKVSSFVAAYSGDTPGYQGIAERAHNRAKDINAAPADKGRFANTTVLLQGHALGSERLLTSIPNNNITIIYDTNVEYGISPNQIGMVDTKGHIFEVSDIKSASEFLNKRNINTEAYNPVALIFNNKLITHPEFKAESVLQTIPETKYKPAYTLRIKDQKSNQVYVECFQDKEGKISLNITNQEKFDEIAESNTISASVLRAMVRQIKFGTLEKSMDAAYELGDVESFQSAIKDNQATLQYSNQQIKTDKPIITSEQLDNVSGIDLSEGLELKDLIPDISKVDLKKAKQNKIEMPTPSKGREV